MLKKNFIKIIINKIPAQEVVISPDVKYFDLRQSQFNVFSKEDLNKIRTRAGLANTSALTQVEILDAILQERRLELFTEFGHRFFDLKRYNKIQSVLSAAKTGWDTHDALFPIPQVELGLNPNLKPQNSGY